MSEASASPGPDQPPPQAIGFDGFVIEPERGRLLGRDGDEIPLRPKALELLIALTASGPSEGEDTSNPARDSASVSVATGTRGGVTVREAPEPCCRRAQCFAESTTTTLLDARAATS